MSTPPHIYTLTGNLLWEKTLRFSQWEPGRTQRAETASFQVGGKGINVSKMLNRLQTPNTAVAFAGGRTGADCREWLQRHGFRHRALDTAAPTRIGVVVRAPGRPETTFLAPDEPVDAAALQACADYLETLPDGQVLAVCGSFPGWENPAAEPLRRALAHWCRRGLLVADTYGPPLAWLAGQPVGLIKINRQEFEALEPASDAPLATRLADLPTRRPAAAWVITDGPRPIWVVSRNAPPQSRQPPAVTEVSPTGSGDVLLACLLHAWLLRGLPLGEALAFAIPYAAANAAHPGVADFDPNQLATPLSNSYPS